MTVDENYALKKQLRLIKQREKTLFENIAKYHNLIVSRDKNKKYKNMISGLINLQAAAYSKLKL